jgi:acyl carrier protein
MNTHDIEDLYPLSPQQQGMLLGTLSAIEPGMYIEQESFTLRERLNLPAFRQAWERILDRHAAFRTAFVWKDQEEPLQGVFRRVELPLQQHDWRGLSTPERAARLSAFLASDRRRGFDLSQAPLMRLALLRIADDRYEFVWTTHHIVMDGWCLPLITKEITVLYAAFCRGEEPELEPAPPYREYIAWLRRQDVAEAESFWRSYLAGFTSPTPLGREEGAFDVGGTRAYGSQDALVSAAATSTLRGLTRQHRVTMSTLAHGAWALLLSRYSGQHDTVVGTTVSGRPPDLPGAESIVGLFINTLPLRVQMVPESLLLPWLADVQARHLDLRRFEYCSAGHVQQWSQVPGWSKLYDSVLVFENYPTNGTPGADAGSDGARFAGAQTAYALTVMLAEGRELLIRVVHDRRRVGDPAAARVLRHFQELLLTIASDPNKRLAELIARIPEDEIPQVSAPRQLEARSMTYVAPRTETEKVLSEMWTEVLGLETVGVNENFFELGGHSLIAMQFMSRLRDTFQLELPLRLLFESSTIAELAVVIEDLLLHEIEALPEEEAQQLLGGLGER